MIEKEVLLVELLEPYIHLIANCLDFFKTKEKILRILLQDGIYIE
jgi:hypothetical protein